MPNPYADIADMLLGAGDNCSYAAATAKVADEAALDIYISGTHVRGDIVKTLTGVTPNTGDEVLVLPVPEGYIVVGVLAAED